MWEHRAVGFEPSNITFLRNRGNCRRLQGSFAEAVEDFDRCAAHAGTAGQCCLARVSIYYHCPPSSSMSASRL